METLSNHNAAVGEEIIIGENGACFLCLKQPNNCNHNTGKVDRHEVSFRSICRYLRINTKSIFVPVLGNDCLSEFWSCGLAVVLCENCGTITKRLSQLLRQMDILQMQVDYNLQQFYNILKESEENDELKQSSSVQENTEADVVEAKIVERLRQKTLTTCDVLMKRKQRDTFPIVLIDRLTETERKKDQPCVPQPSSDDTVALSTNCNANDTQTDLVNKIRNYEEDVTNSQETITEEKHVEHYEQLAPSDLQKLCFKKTNLENKLACRFCQLKISSTSFASKLHVINFHPEKFFLSSKLENVGEGQFQICCQHLLQVQMKKAVMTAGKREYNCAHCSWKGTKYKYHLIAEHLSLLENKLKKYQRDQVWKTARHYSNSVSIKNQCSKNVSDNNIKYYRPRSTNSPVTKVLASLYTKGESRADKQRPTRYCSVCKIQVINQMAHLVSRHLGECFVGKKLENMSDTSFQECCACALNTAVNQAKLQRKQNGIDMRLECKFCKYWTYKNQPFLDHVLKIHYPLVEQVLMEEQNKCVSTQQSHQNSAIKTENPECEERTQSSPAKKVFSANHKRKTAAISPASPSKSGVRSKKMKGNKGRKKVTNFTLDSRNNYKDVMSSILATGKLVDLKGSKKSKLEILNSCSTRQNPVSSSAPKPGWKSDTSLVQLEVYGEENQEAAQLTKMEVTDLAIKTENLQNLSNLSEEMETVVHPANEDNNLSMDVDLPESVSIKTEVDLNECS